jgi:hypothetical protein
MKKWIVFFSALVLAAPAMAADWEFYGSQRMATFYVYDDFGDAAGNDEGYQWYAGAKWQIDF